MADDVGTTYFSYLGPSPSQDNTIYGSQSQGHRNTVRSEQSVISSRGDNNDITTLAVRPYQSNVPESITSPCQSVLLLSPPYPGYNLPCQQQYLAPPYSSFESLPRDERSTNYYNMSQKAHPDFTKGTETLRQCVFVLGIVFLLVFAAAIFMAVYFGNSYT